MADFICLSCAFSHFSKFYHLGGKIEFSSKKNKTQTKTEKVCVLWMISSPSLEILHESPALAKQKLLHVFSFVRWKAEMEAERKEQRRNNSADN